MAMDVEKEIKALQKAIESLRGDMRDLEASSESVAGNIGKSTGLMKSGLQSMQKITIESAKFALNLQAQYTWAEKLAKVSKKTAVNIGLAVGRSGEFTKNFNKATSQLQKFGGEAADVSNIIERFSNQSGRARIITPDEIKNIYLLEKGLNVADESAAELLENMDLMGMNAAKANAEINEMVVSSQKLGLNASKVAKALADNFKTMQTYSFAGGVKGMTKMAEQAVKMRADVGTMLSMSEKFYEPEAAIEAVANLQMLGGDVAKAFGDPFEIMYLARNKPEELAERVQEMTENMLQFNDETGQYELPAEARMQLKAVGDQLGINVDQMVDIARQSSKISDIKMNVSGNILDDDLREGVAGMATMGKGGNWKVDFKGEEIDISDVGPELAKEMLAAPADADEAIMDMAMNSMTTNEILDNILIAIKTGYVAKANVYEAIEEGMRPAIEGAFAGVEDNIKKLSEEAVGTPAKNLMDKLNKQITDQGKALPELGKKMFDRLGIELQKAFDDAEKKGTFKKMFEKLDTELILKDPFSVEDEIPESAEQDFISRPGGRTSFSSTDHVLGIQAGGPVDSLLQTAGITRNAGVEGGIVNNNPIVKVDPININGRIELISPSGEIKGLDMNKIKSAIEPIIINAINQSSRNGGVLSSKETVDRGI